MQLTMLTGRAERSRSNIWYELACVDEDGHVDVGMGDVVDRSIVLSLCSFLALAGPPFESGRFLDLPSSLPVEADSLAPSIFGAKNNIDFWRQK